MKRIFSIFLAFSVVLTALADDITFTGSAPSAVAAGKQFRVEYTVNARGTEIRCDIEGHGLDLLYGPSSSSSISTSYVNGKVTTKNTTTFSYMMMGQQEGTFTLPAATVKVDGKTYTSNTVTVKVLPADKAESQQSASGGNGNGQNASSRISKDDVLLRLDLSKTTAYEGEAIVATLKLYFKNHAIRSISDAKIADFEGFTKQDVTLADNRQAQLEHINGANYQMYPIAQWLLFPTRNGDIEIPAQTVKAVAEVVTRRSSGGFFDWPMDYTQAVEVPATAPARTVRVNPLPAGRPASFMGGVGSYTVESAVSSTELKEGDAFTYRITISGTGNFKQLKDPEPQFPADFEVYDPKIDFNTRTTGSGISGKKTIEYTVIPRFAGSFDIPGVPFSYFDTQSGAYKTVSTQAFHLEVAKGANTSGNDGGVADFSGTSQERIKMLGNDIRYLHGVDENALQKSAETFFGTTAFWLWIILPLLAFIILAVVYRRQLRLNADTAGVRTRKASKVATKRLKEASAALKTHNEAAFYEAVHKAVLGYVSDKLNLQRSELTADNLKEQLAQHSVNEELIAQAADVISTCEFARYAPSGDNAAMDTLYGRAVDTIDKLDNAIRK